MLSWPLSQIGRGKATTFDVTLANPVPATGPTAALHLHDLCQQNLTMVTEAGALYYRQPSESCMCVPALPMPGHSACKGRVPACPADCADSTTQACAWPCKFFCPLQRAACCTWVYRGCVRPLPCSACLVIIGGHVIDSNSTPDSTPATSACMRLLCLLHAIASMC